MEIRVTAVNCFTSGGIPSESSLADFGPEDSESGRSGHRCRRFVVSFSTFDATPTALCSAPVNPTSDFTGVPANAACMAVSPYRCPCAAFSSEKRERHHSALGASQHAAGAACRGTFVYTTERTGEGTLNCDDGRSGPFTFVSTGRRGTGSGSLNGRPFTFTFGG